MSTAMNTPSSPSILLARRWILIAPLLLVLHVSLMMVAVMKATGDASFAVVPDYYRKSLEWDQRKEALARSAALGWKFDLATSARVDEMGMRELTVSLRDSQGRPIDDMTVSVSYFHLARAGEGAAAELKSLGNGLYAASVRLPAEGFCEFRVDARHASGDFVADVSRYVTGSRPARPIGNAG